MTREMTLAIDCGGGGIKGSVVDERGTMMAPPRRVPTPYPLPPELLVETVVGLARELPAATRVTMGMPGMIRHGVVIATPHYITRDGTTSIGGTRLSGLSACPPRFSTTPKSLVLVRSPAAVSK